MTNIRVYVEPRPDNKCHLALGYDCEAPANGPGKTRCQCFACGQAVCKKCSRIVAKYYSYGRRRICEQCVEDHKLEEN